MREKGTDRGLISGIAAYSIWGFFPVYFKYLSKIPSLTVVCHRILWSAIFLLLVISIKIEWGKFTKLRASKKTLLILFTTALLISVNWLVFIKAVADGEVLQSSLGYFITPIVNVGLGVIVLGEKLNTARKIAVALALSGVLIQVALVGKFPLTAVILALTFGLYGLLRKIASVDPLHGLFAETAVLGIPSLAFLYYSGIYGGAAEVSAIENLLLMLAGIVTAVPLLLFADAARKLKLTTIGFLQYITPTMHFMQALFLYHESFNWSHFISFAIIWSALALYTLDAVKPGLMARQEGG